MRAAQLYKTFHGHAVRWMKRFSFHQPQLMIVLGHAVAIEYQCDKINGGGDGTQAVYRHEFETPVFLCMDEKSAKQLYLIGKKITVTEAGIEH